MQFAYRAVLGLAIATGVAAAPRVAGSHAGSIHIHSHRAQRYGHGAGYWGWYGFDEPYFNPGAYEEPAPAPGSLIVVNPSAAPAAPAAPVRSVIHEYARPEDYEQGNAAAGGPVVYLIAFRDKNIRAAGTYWVEGANLHYLDTDHKERQAPLDSIDRELSAQLNRERRVPFHLP